MHDFGIKTWNFFFCEIEKKSTKIGKNVKKGHLERPGSGPKRMKIKHVRETTEQDFCELFDFEGFRSIGPAPAIQTRAKRLLHSQLGVPLYFPSWPVSRGGHFGPSRDCLAVAKSGNEGSKLRNSIDSASGEVSLA